MDETGRKITKIAREVGKFTVRNMRREGVGADLAWDDGLRDDDVLLVPPPFDSLYPHYLCAMTDAALGENDRYAGEQAQYNSILAELAGWLRRNCRPARGSRWRW